MMLITGATGFVGQALTAMAIGRNLQVRAISRGVHPACVSVGAITGSTDWTALLDGVDSIVHLAARVHVLDDTAADPLAQFRAMNVAATLNLAGQAAKAGVRRFVFVSSIKVNGEETQEGRVYTADDMPNPMDPYGQSKLEAEIGLRELASATGLEVVIIRPPLIYGPGVKANFSAMMRWLQRGVPLPLGAVTENRRSLIGVDNLADLILRAAEHHAAANQLFLASDGEDVSTTELLRRLALALHCSARLVPLPPRWLSGVAALAGRQNIARRLLGSLRVDSSATRKVLDWTPPFNLDEGLEKAAKAFRGLGPRDAETT